MHGVRSVCLAPRAVDGSLLRSLRELQPVLHKMIDGVARDVPFVTQAIKARMPPCAWQERELEIYRRTSEFAARKPRLLLPNSIYLQPAAQPLRAIYTVGNVQAGEPFLVELLHRQLREQQKQQQHHASSAGSSDPATSPPLPSPPLEGPLRMHCAAIASAAKLVHRMAPCVAVLSKPKELLARRTSTDVHGIGELLLSAYGVHKVLYVSMRDLANATVATDASNDLILGEDRISLIYSRYDFSHPTGAPMDSSSVARVLSGGDTFTNPWGLGSGNAALGYGSREGEDGDSSSVLAHTGRERLAELWREWETVEKMERSSAVISSSLGCRLAHRRGVMHALHQPGGVERFLSDESEVAAVRAVLPEQWSLRPRDAESHAAARALVEAEPSGFIAKNVLRPRTGSNATQDRHASGGMPLTSAQGVSDLVLSDDDPDARRDWYLLYRKIAPATHGAVVRHTDGEIYDLGEGGAVSELAVYGAFLSLGEGVAAPDEPPIVNECAGMAARTRPVDAGHPLSAHLGYGALSCIAEQQQQQQQGHEAQWEGGGSGGGAAAAAGA